MIPKFLAALTLLSAASAAMAAEAYLVDSTDLYAGPDEDYPQITALPAGVPVTVYGCTDGWEWCDVQTPSDRGWVSGEFLQYEYQNQRVFLPSYGARIGIPIVAFALGTYWQAHYASRPWYGQREEWSHRSFAHRPAPRPHGYTQNAPGPARHEPDHGGPGHGGYEHHDNEHAPQAHNPAANHAQVVRDRSVHPSAATQHPVQGSNAPANHARAARPVAHPTSTPAQTQRSAPRAVAPKQPAAVKHEAVPNKGNDKKDDGHH
jgi:uncharacterized protein YraI